MFLGVIIIFNRMLALICALLTTVSIAQALESDLLENFSSKGYVRTEYQSRAPQIEEQPSDLRESVDAQFELDWSSSDFSVDTLSYVKYRPQYADQNKALRDDLEWNADLREWILAYESDQWLYRLGKQQVAWGKGDYFRIVDVINPLDLREGLLTYIDDYSLGRQPRNMVVVEHYQGGVEFQFVAAYETQETLLAPAQADFSLNGYPDDPKLEDNSNIDLGFRARFFLEGTDLDIYFFDGYNPDPMLALNSRNQIEGEFAKRQLVALSFARPVEYGVIRSDMAYYSKEALQLVDGFDSASKVDLLIGFDAQENEWSFNFQGAVSQYMSVSDAYTRNKRISSASVYIEKQWSQLRLSSSILCLYNFQDNSSTMLKYLVSYEWFNSTSVEAGLIAFDGPSNSLHGMYDEQDRIYMSVKYSF
jgi:hypothetical protein